MFDAAVQQQLQPRAKARDPRVFTVVRAAAISIARPSAAPPSGAISARSTRGLTCSELCQTREQFDRLLTRVFTSAVSSADGNGAQSAGSGSAAGSAASAPPSGATAASSPAPSGAQQQRRGAEKGRPQSPNCNTRSGATANRSERGSTVPSAEVESRQEALSLVLPGKRMPLFPRSMRLSSECLSWLHATERGAHDRHVYFLAEEMHLLPPPRSATAARGRSAVGATRALAERLAKSTEVTAVSIAGADLRVLLPELEEDSDDAPNLHLRPASVEHLLAVDSLWPRMDPADRQVLTSCYTPRETPHARRLSTLYVPLSDGPQPADHDPAMGTSRRLRPMRLPELLELLRIYVVREPQPAAATLALPLALATDERAAELRTHPDDEVLQHVYCTLAPSGSASGTAAQCYVLQMQPAGGAGATDGAMQDDASPAIPALVEMCQNGQLHEALQTSVQLRKTGLIPPSTATTALVAALAGAQKEASAQTELTAVASKELSPPTPEGPPAPSNNSARGRSRNSSGSGAKPSEN